MSCFQWIIQVIIHTLNYKDDSLVKGLNCCLLAVANCLFVLRETTMAESANWLFLVLRASRRWCSHIKQSGGIFCPRQPILSFFLATELIQFPLRATDWVCKYQRRHVTSDCVHCTLSSPTREQPCHHVLTLLTLPLNMYTVLFTD